MSFAARLTVPAAIAVLAAALVLPLPASAAPDLAPQAPPPASPELYSFADFYRLAGGAELPPAWRIEPEVQFRVRTVAGEPAAASAAYVFSVGGVPRPGGGLLALAGLAAVLWVVRRRMGYAIRG